MGYRHGLAAGREVPFDPYGAFAPMGGVFSTVSDLSRWVAGFAAAFPPDGDGTAPTDGRRPATRTRSARRRGGRCSCRRR